MKRTEGKIEGMLRGQRKHLSFHTPGHKRVGADITELPYSDNLFSPRGVIAEAERDVAEILGADRSFLLTDGSTSGVHAMLYALRLSGGKKVAVPAFSHPSVFRGCEILGLTPVLIQTERRRGIPLQPTEEQLSAARKADALLLTSPDYYGFCAPLLGARKLCDELHIPLLVDGAHGSHLHFTPLHAGKYADLWVDGVHKSLPALTQGAVVSARGEWVERLKEGVLAFRTTSPSYPILASVECAVKYPRSEKVERVAERCRREIGAIPNDDWSKLVVPFGAYSDEAESVLEKKGIYPEFNDGNYLMFYLSPCNKPRDLKKLARALAPLSRGEVKEDAQGAIPLYTVKS